MLDGNSSPWLAPTQGVYVFNAGTPAVVYPTPSTTGITRTYAKSWANVYTGGQAGTAHLQLGTSTAYELADDPVSLSTAFVNWQIWDDWFALQPDTLYHFRVWFHATASGLNTYGIDQTFRHGRRGRGVHGERGHERPVGRREAYSHRHGRRRHRRHRHVVPRRYPV